VAGPVPIDRIVSLKHLPKRTSSVTLLAYVDRIKLWSRSRQKVLGKIYINDPLLYGSTRIIYTEMFFSRYRFSCAMNAAARDIPLFQFRFVHLHLLGDIVPRISPAHYISSKWF
jgi:hypothetical protein